MSKAFFGNIGIDYAFPEKRIKARLFERPEDFIVQEILRNGKACSVAWENTEIARDDSKPFVHATLVKRKLSTFDACFELAEKNNLDYFNELCFCGLKDTNAITAQRICFPNTGKIDAVSSNNFFLKDFCFSGKRIGIGDHKGNLFTIRAKGIGLPREEARAFLEESKARLAAGLPNFYGPQRFGIRQNSHLLGKLLLQKRYSDFVFDFLTCSRNESKPVEEARIEICERFGDWKEILKILEGQPEMADERTLVSGLSKGISEIGAIKKMRTANFFVHSYSSYLFNKALSGFLKQGHESARIEKIGASSKLDGLNQRLFAPILEKEGIALEDFKQEEKIFRIEGRPRNALFFPKRFCFSTRKNETVLKFALGKGEYASIVLNFLFESDLEKLD